MEEGLSAGDVFRGFPRPTPEECETLSEELFAIHGQAQKPAGTRAPVVDALFNTMLSQNTTAANSKVSPSPAPDAAQPCWY